MIKAILKGGGERDIVVLGFTAGNVEELRAGKPVYIEAADLGLPSDVLVMYAETVPALVAELREHGIDLPQLAEPRPGEARWWTRSGPDQPLKEETNDGDSDTA